MKCGTTTSAVSVCVFPPPRPVTVNRYRPGETEDPTSIVSVVVPVGVTEVLVNGWSTPVGRPETLSATGKENPSMESNRTV